MTGNTNKWRAPLAGLASLAMLATMGVAATTANAADPTQTVTFSISGNTVNTQTVRIGQSIADALNSYNAGFGSYTVPAGYVFTGWNKDFLQQVNNNAETTQVTGSVKLQSDAVKIEFTGVTTAQFTFPDGATGTSYYVNGNTTLGTRIPRDVVDGKAVTKWTYQTYDGSTPVGLPKDTNDLSSIPTTNLVGKTIKISPKNGIASADKLVVKYAYGTGYLTGAYADGNPTISGVSDADYIADIAKGQIVKLPSTWSNFDGQTAKPNALYDGDVKYDFGATVTGAGSNITLNPSDATTSNYAITFRDSDGTIKYTGYAKQNSEDPAKGALLAEDDRAAIADIKIDGYVVKGWKIANGDSNVEFKLPQSELDAAAQKRFGKDYDEIKNAANKALVEKDALLAHNFTNADLDNTLFHGAVEFVPAQGGTTGTVTVTFRDDTYVGANKAVTVDAKGGTYLSSDQFPSWTREGYVFAGWYLSDAKGNVIGSQFDANSLIGEGDFATNFTVVATWEKVNATVLDAALTYINPNDTAKNYGQFFTSETYGNFKSTYQKVFNEKKQLEYAASDSKVSDADAAKLVTELKAGWEQLKFNAEGNPTLNDLSDTNSFVFRLHKGGLRLYSQTPREIYAAQRTGWTVDNGYLFRAASRNAQGNADFRNLNSFKTAASKVVSGAEAQTALADKLDAIADPIVTTVERFSAPNGADWVYVDSNNTKEINSLNRGGWSHEGVAFAVPTFGGTPVVRFAKNGQHLMSTGATEQASLARNGWTREGVAFRGL